MSHQRNGRPRAAALLAALALGWAAQPAGAEPITATAAEALSPPPGCGAVLSDPCLRAMLDQLGLAPKPLSKGYMVTIPNGTWQVIIQGVISENGRKLGLNSNLGVVNEAEVSGAQWRALLAANGDLDPSGFYYDPAKTKLYMHRSLDTRQVTPAILLRELTGFASTVVSSSTLWSFTH